MTRTFREQEIRPADTASEQKRLYAKDVARMLERRTEFVEVSCPACEEMGRTHRFDKDGMNYVECSSCATVYISPRPSPELLADYYASSEAYAYWNDVIFPASESVRRERIMRPRVDRLLELSQAHGVGTDTLLEIGSGFGTFCGELLSRSVFGRVVAVEPTPDLAATCRGRGIEVIEKRWEEIDASERADVVAAFEVIEHLFEPRAFLLACRKLLHPGGLLFLTCPNIRGFDMEILGVDAPSIDAEHLNYFHPASLKTLLETTGFAVLESLTPGRLDAEIVRNRVIAGEFELRDPFLHRILLDEWDRLGEPFQNFLSSSCLSSHLWIVARRLDE